MEPSIDPAPIAALNRDVGYGTVGSEITALDRLPYAVHGVLFSIVKSRMSLSFNSVASLESPFLYLDEQALDIPADRVFRIHNTHTKAVFLTKGECFVQIDKQPPVRFRAGDVMLFNRKCEQYYISPSPGKPCRIYVMLLVFDPECIRPPRQLRNRGNRGPKADGETAIMLRALLGDTYVVPSSQTAEIKTLIATIRVEAELRRSCYKVRINSICREICVLLYRHCDNSPGAVNGSSSKGGFVVEKVKAFIMANMSAHLTLDKIAWHAGWSGPHLARVFKKTAGESVFSYLRRVRLDEARLLLITTNKPISKISKDIGISSPAVFARAFRAHAGLTAKAFRDAKRPDWREDGPNLRSPSDFAPR